VGRASLPGADELFGSSGSWPGRSGSSEEPTRVERHDPDLLATSRALGAPETGALAAARERAAATFEVPSPEVGALLRWTARRTEARTVVEVGSAGGVSGLWLLGGLTDHGVLTSIEPDVEAHEMARDAFASVEGGRRVRSINGEVATVLSRLAEDSYDLVLLQSEPTSYLEDLDLARRLLRRGGVLVALGVLRPGDDTESVRRFLQAVIEDPGLDTIVLPVDDGVALATRIDDGG
jgi:predicted O-methyltransferase YrrM